MYIFVCLQIVGSGSLEMNIDGFGSIKKWHRSAIYPQCHFVEQIVSVFLQVYFYRKNVAIYYIWITACSRRACHRSGTRHSSPGILPPPETQLLYYFIYTVITVRSAAPETTLWGGPMVEIRFQDGQSKGMETDHTSLA